MELPNMTNDEMQRIASMVSKNITAANNAAVKRAAEDDGNKETKKRKVNEANSAVMTTDSDQEIEDTRQQLLNKLGLNESDADLEDSE